MKKTTTLFAFLITLSASAQSVDFYYDGPDANVYNLLEYPSDPTRLLQATWVTNPAPTPSGYVIEEITNGTLNTLSFPLCNQITLAPHEVSGGFLMPGNTTNLGNEVFFFDGTNTYTYDINPGALGSDMLSFNTVEGETYFSANNGSQYQAFRFVNASTVEQLTNETEPVISVCAKWGDTLYYNVQGFNPVTSNPVFKLKKAMWNGVDYDYAQIRELEVPSGGTQVSWRDPVIKWGKLFLTESVIDWSSTQSTPRRVISVDSNSQVIEYFELYKLGFSKLELFEWNNKLYSYLNGESDLYSTLDGLSFPVESTVSGGNLVDDKVVDGNFYLSVSKNNGTFDFVNYDGSFTPLFNGPGYLKFREDNDGLFYLAQSPDVNGSAVVYYVNTATDEFNSVQVGDGNILPFDNASIIFENQFTFLFQNLSPTDNSTDVLQLSNILALEEAALETGTIYPNPITNKEMLHVKSDRSDSYLLYNSHGMKIQSGRLVIGENPIELNNLEAGVYFFVTEKSVEKLMIE